MNLKTNDKVRMISHESKVSYGDTGEIIEVYIGFFGKEVALIRWKKFRKGLGDNKLWVTATDKLEKIAQQLEFDF